VGIGVFLAAIILFLGTKHWVETRTLRAVDMPVSLSHGTISTGAFNVNVQAFYSILIGREEGGNLNCDGVGLRTRRISSLGGLVVYHLPDERGEVAENITFGSFLGGFEGKPGRYNLEIEVLSDTGCMNALKPRLYIIASDGDFAKWSSRYENAFWISFISGSIGLALLIIGFKDSCRWRPTENSNLSFSESRSDEHMRPAMTRRIGIALVLVGPILLICAIRWLAPHPHVALIMPVSLSPGHLTTGNFSVNPDTLYYIDIETDKRFPNRAECEPRSVLSTRWVLSSDGRVERGSSPWEDTGLTVAVLYSENTRYAFDVDILPGANCLNASNPRLKVQTHPYPSDSYVALTWFSILPVGIGLVLLIRPYVSRRFSKIEGTSIFTAEKIEHQPLRRTPMPKMILPVLPLIGLLCAQLFAVVLIVGGLVVGYAWRYRYPSVGLFVLTDLSPTMKGRTCGEAWVVRVDKRENWYLNSTRTSQQELAGLLGQQLGEQRNCAVYLDVAPSLSYEVAIQAIDTIRTTKAKAVVLLTREARKAPNRR
jgi:hypothetical protein